MALLECGNKALRLLKRVARGHQGAENRTCSFTPANPYILAQLCSDMVSEGRPPPVHRSLTRLDLLTVDRSLKSYVVSFENLNALLHLVATMPDLSASQWEFPKEIWQRVTYWVPRMKDQPHWHAWTELRTLNRAFKTTIEDYYLEHYVKRTEIHVRSGELVDLYGGMGFSFTRFDDMDKRMAIFTDNDADDYSDKDNRSRAVS